VLDDAGPQRRHPLHATPSSLRRWLREHRLGATTITLAAAVVLLVATALILRAATHRAAAADANPAFVIAGAGITHPLVGVPANGTPFGPAIQRLRDLNANLLECEYAHGAARQPTIDGGSSFQVSGVTDETRRACAPEQTAIDALQRTQAYADDAAATVQITRGALACVAARDIPDASPDNAVAAVPIVPNLAPTEEACKAQLEREQHLTEPSPLP
jgi:hypothetical protein